MTKKIILLLVFLISAPVAEAKQGVIIDLVYGLRSGLLSRLLAKELCSCLFVTGLPKETCIAHSNLGIPSVILNSRLSIRENMEEKTVVVGPAALNLAVRSPTSKAQFRHNEPLSGCQLVDL